MPPLGEHSRPRNSPATGMCPPLPAGWSHRHLADRFMWMDGAVGVAEALSGGDNHGYPTFRSNAQAVAACVVASAALGTVAPPPGQLPAAVHCVHYNILRGLTVYTRNDTPAEGQQEVPRRPPARRWPPLIETDVRHLIADAIRHPPRENPA